MNSTITQKAKPRKRKPQSRKRPAPSRRRVTKKSAPAFGIADWMGLGIDAKAGGLPEWTDLSSGKNKRKKVRNVRKQVDSLLDQVSTSRFALVLLIAALGLGFYVNHVFATQDALSFLEEQRRDNLRLELQYNQLKGQLDKKISPNAIYRRAQELGLREGLAFEPKVKWQLEETD